MHIAQVSPNKIEDSLGLVIIVLGILIWRIWKASENLDTNDTGPKPLQFIARILMESGILYLAIGIAHLASWFGHSRFNIVLLGIMVSLSQDMAPRGKY